jgi:ribonuclease HII
MPDLIGVDEAGYGPNLGPLTITGTFWKNNGSQDCLYNALADVIKRLPDRTRDSRLVVADSKAVYKSSGSIKKLETTVLSFLLALKVARQKTVAGEPDHEPLVPQTVREMIELACPSAKWSSIDLNPGYDFPGTKLPLKADPADIVDHTQQLVLAMEEANVALAAIYCWPIFAGEFNRCLQTYGNKATLLSNRSMNVVANLKPKSTDDLEIVCDKHGGRNHYLSLIKTQLTNQSVATGEETRTSSDYSFTESSRDVVIRFQAGGESFMPTALASMVSKYIREVFMEAWNQFWIKKIPGLKPTKGYPVDAKRFKSAINQAQKSLDISDHDIWRKK